LGFEGQCRTCNPQTQQTSHAEISSSVLPISICFSAMTFQQLDNVHNARPFRPFTLHIADGRSFRVPHPEFLSRSPSGRTIIVYGSDESFSVLDLLLLTELEVHPRVSGEAAA
jgi:hypothetical protein